MDYLRNLLLDAVDLKADICIRCVRKVFAPFLETTQQQKLMLIPYKLLLMMDGIVAVP
jgi:hypothetical protein